jgi:hypothetical protein
VIAKTDPKDQPRANDSDAFPKFDPKPADSVVEFPRARQTRPVEELRFQVTAYLWLPHVTGRVKPLAAAPTMTINTSIGDLIRDSDGAFMLTGTARKDRFVFLWDFNYSGSSKEGQAVAPIAGGIPVSATAKIRQVSATLMTGTSVYQKPQTTVDILGGIRIWRVKAEVAATLPPPFNFASGSKAWVDPLAGIRIRQALSQRWSLILYGDAGGFNAGSRFSGQFAGTVNFRATKHFYVSGGYRHLSVDYRKNNRIIDLDMSGPVMGATWVF